MRAAENNNKAGMMKFTASQEKAIGFANANIQLIACAGSGKTEVVARRVVHLLQSGGGALAPRNIIAFTFTDKAAAELKERIVSGCVSPLVIFPAWRRCSSARFTPLH